VKLFGVKNNLDTTNITSEILKKTNNLPNMFISKSFVQCKKYQYKSNSSTIQMYSIEEVEPEMASFRLGDEKVPIKVDNGQLLVPVYSNNKELQSESKSPDKMSALSLISLMASLWQKHLYKFIPRKFVSIQEEMGTGDKEKLDPFVLRIQSIYDHTIISADYEIGPSLGYVIRIKENEIEAVMGKEYPKEHIPTREKKLSDLVSEPKKPENWDAYTKILGEGARFNCVRELGNKLTDNSVLFVPLPPVANPYYVYHSPIIAVEFNQLWLTWGKTFHCKYGIKDSEIATELKNNNLKTTTDGRSVVVIPKRDDRLYNQLGYNLETKQIHERLSDLWTKGDEPQKPVEQKPQETKKPGSLPGLPLYMEREKKEREKIFELTRQSQNQQALVKPPVAQQQTAPSPAPQQQQTKTWAPIALSPASQQQQTAQQQQQRQPPKTKLLDDLQQRK
jgi:hypothetical protein